MCENVRTVTEGNESMEEKNQDIRENTGQDFGFMKERIKERPLNKKKLIRRTIITASMAVIFGLVACLTVLLLEPLLSNWLYPEAPPENITFPQETQEMSPEDMALDDDELRDEPDLEEITQEIVNNLGDRDDRELLNEIYNRLGQLTDEVSRSLVTVTGVTSDMDWFDNTFESSGQTSGVIVADNGREYLVLVNKAPVETVESIKVTFCDGVKVDAQVKKADSITGLAVLAVDKKKLTDTTQRKIGIASLGSSNGTDLVGKPVIALGSPVGVGGSVMYGVVTSAGNALHTVDSKYKLITTDMYGSENGTGILVNLDGQLVGVINQHYNNRDMSNAVSAIGISELKKTIERLSNGKNQVYLGVYGTDVTVDAHERLKVPYGTYVTEIVMDSPAMRAGIQSGDVIVAMDGRDISTYQDYIEALREMIPGNTGKLTVMRQTQEEYKSMELQIVWEEND